MAKLRAMLVEIKNVRAPHAQPHFPLLALRHPVPAPPPLALPTPRFPASRALAHPLRPSPSPRRPQTKLLVAKEMQGATFCISEAVWAAGDFRKRVIDAPQRERSLVRVKVRHENVAGVKLPVFTLVRAAGKAGELETLGLAGGGRQIGAARDKFTSLLDLLTKLGSLQTSFLTLDEAIKVTNRRVNALDNVRCGAPRRGAFASPSPPSHRSLPPARRSSSRPSSRPSTT